MLCSSTNQKLLKRTFVIKVATDDLMEAITCLYHKIDTFFVVNKDEWYTKEGRAKSMKNALYVQRYGKKAPLGLKRRRTAKKSGP